MTLKEFYTVTGGDYDGTLARLITEARILKFAQKFKDDPSYNELCSALEKGNAENAFLAAHTLKGVSQNLGFNALYRTSSEVTEILRAGSLDVGMYMDELKSQYTAIVDALAALES